MYCRLMLVLIQTSVVVYNIHFYMMVPGDFYLDSLMFNAV